MKIYWIIKLLQIMNVRSLKWVRSSELGIRTRIASGEPGERLGLFAGKWTYRAIDDPHAIISKHLLHRVSQVVMIVHVSSLSSECHGNLIILGPRWESHNWGILWSLVFFDLFSALNDSIVVNDDYFDGKMVPRRCLKLHSTEAKGWVTDNHNNFLVWVEVLSRDSKAKAYAHRSKSTRIKSLQWSVILKNCAADIHRVWSFRHNYIVFTISCNLVLNDANRGVIIHGESLIQG